MTIYSLYGQEVKNEYFLSGYRRVYQEQQTLHENI